MNKIKLSRRGFTLIELLVVIAIIGILSAVVLASLNTARNKASNAAIKSAMSSARAQSAIFFDPGQVYTGLCAATAANNGLVDLRTSVVKNNGGTLPISAPPGLAADEKCYNDTNNFVYAARLRVAEGANAWWCVDSAGKSEAITDGSVITGIGTLCP
jgi:prepilin-type N-terminal cleavage/methylation domain-containing protein